MKSSKVILNILSVVCFIYGALYVFSLVFIPIGIYCFLAGRRFSFKADHPNDIFSLPNVVFRNYVIFSSIFCLPFGLLSIIPYILLTGNNVHVDSSNTQYSSQTVDEKPKEEVETQSLSDTESLSEKQEKYEKLKKFNEKGLITDDELKQAYDDLFKNKKED